MGRLSTRGASWRRAVKGLSLWTTALVLFAACEPTGQLPPAVRAYPQLILYNGKILTMDRDDASATVAEALAIRDGRILAVGKQADILKLAGPQTQKEDLGGKTVIPGIIDTHTHPMEYAMDRTETLGLPEILRPTGSNWAEIKARTLAVLKDEAVRRPAGQWIRVVWPNRSVGPDGALTDVKVMIVNGLMTRRDLDPLTPNHPVMLRGSTRTVFNGKAIDVMKDVYGGYDEDLNLETGISISVLIPRALTNDVIAGGLDKVVKAFKEELQAWAGYGVTTFSSSISSLSGLTAYAELARKGDMPIRYAYTLGQGYTSTSAEAALQFYRRVGNFRGLGDDHLWDVGASVVNLDGSYPQMKTSIDAPKSIKGREISFSTPGQPRRRILDSLIREGFRIAGVHVAGDAALDDYLTAIEEQSRARGMTDEQIRAMRHAVDHCAFNPRPDQYPRLKKLGIIVSCGPKYIPTNSPAAAADYGPGYAKWVVPVKSMLDAGVKVVYESDINDLNTQGPLYYLQLLVTRKDKEGKVWSPEERVDRMTALRMATRWAAEYVLREKELGSLEPGKWADLVVLDRDYATVPEDQISDIRVLKTLVGGKVAYEKK